MEDFYFHAAIVLSFVLGFFIAWVWQRKMSDRLIKFIFARASKSCRKEMLSIIQIYFGA